MSSSATMHAKSPVPLRKQAGPASTVLWDFANNPSPGLGHHLASAGACVPAVTSLLRDSEPRLRVTAVQGARAEARGCL